MHCSWWCLQHPKYHMLQITMTWHYTNVLINFCHNRNFIHRVCVLLGHCLSTSYVPEIRVQNQLLLHMHWTIYCVCVCVCMYTPMFTHVHLCACTSASVLWRGTNVIWNINLQPRNLTPGESNQWTSILVWQSYNSPSYWSSQTFNIAYAVIKPVLFFFSVIE